MKILVCDRLEEKVLDKFEELGEITNISESKTKTEDLKSNIVDTEIVVIRSGTKINKDIFNLKKKICLYYQLYRRSGRVVECTGLENRRR